MTAKQQIDNFVHELKIRLRDFDLQLSNIRAAREECSALLGRAEKLQDEMTKAVDMGKQ